MTVMREKEKRYAIYEGSYLMSEYSTYGRYDDEVDYASFEEAEIALEELLERRGLDYEEEFFVAEV